MRECDEWDCGWAADKEARDWAARVAKKMRNMEGEMVKLEWATLGEWKCRLGFAD